MVQRGHRVATAGHGDQVTGFGFGRRILGCGVGGFVEGLNLKRAQWAVPDHGFGTGKDLRDMRHAVGACIKDHHVGGHVLGHDGFGIGTGLELSRDNHVTGQQQFAARLGGFVRDVARGVGQIVFTQRFAHIEALSGEERIGHSAADDDDIDLVDQIAKQVQLGGDFRPAHHSHHRPFGAAKRLFQRLQFFGHQAACAVGQQFGHAGGRGMGAVGGGEGIVAEHIAEGGEELRHFGIVRLFHSRKTRVFDEDHSVRRGGLDRLAVGAFDEGDGAAQRGLKRGHGDTQGHVRDVFALGPTKVGQHHGLAPLGEDVGDCRFDPFDAGGVGDFAILHRHVDVHAGEYDFAVQIHIVECVPAHGSLLCYGAFIANRVRGVNRMGFWRVGIPVRRA